MTPTKYLQLRSEKGSRLAFRRGVVAVLLSFAFVGFLHLFEKINLYGDNGLIDRVGDLVSTLTGFYVAALVAVATFGPGRPEMDGSMVSGKLYVGVGESKQEVSRREYLTALFGYLVTLAFILSLASIVVAVVGGAFNALDGEAKALGFQISYHSILSYGAASLYFSLLFHLIMETSIGLHYLIEKLYRVKPEITPGSLNTNLATDAEDVDRSR